MIRYIHLRQFSSCGLKFIDTTDLCTDDIHRILWASLDLKAHSQTLGKPLVNRRVTLLCQRQCGCINFVVQSALKNLGADLRLMVAPRWELSRYRRDVGRFHSLYSDLILVQSRNHKRVCELVDGANATPVVNISSHMFTPLHGLGLLATLQEHFGHLDGLTVAWLGPLGNHLNTLLYLLPKVGVHLRYNCSPRPDHPGSPIVKQRSLSICETHNTSIQELRDPAETIRGADVIATAKHRRETVRIELKMTETAKNGWVFLHMLPRWEGDVCEEVFTHKNSLVWKLHENIYYTTMAVVMGLLENYKPTMSKPNFGKITH
ncbi:ornithine transcarbamylase, mitochondrial-like isoform X2 [Macrosteles quadrilineatus]|uniref:ornithine transcarbamylase, mitochondrial-like isoform X2 n=1 Tax=Macrosteles quadrilineatus TaxID=74068 RepID=UPI0023E11ACA|nr:ornithine transcarbamylase, mitochondrial-like isoform X2 [Macrosteles quadrilineatus]